MTDELDEAVTATDFYGRLEEATAPDFPDNHNSLAHREFVVGGAFPGMAVDYCYECNAFALRSWGD